MFEGFLVIVGAIVVAQVMIAAIGLAVVMNKRFVKWYMKKVNKMAKEMMEEAVELVEEMEL